MPSKDFKSNQIRTTKLIASGAFAGGGAQPNNNIGIAIYSASNAQDVAGGIKDTKAFDQVGSDVMMVVSGNIGGTGASTGFGPSGNEPGGITLFTGDVYVSGNLGVEGSGGGGGGANTLDQAYDQSGAGAGRIITADAGPVQINSQTSEGLIVSGNVGFGQPSTEYSNEFPPFLDDTGVTFFVSGNKLYTDNDTTPAPWTDPTKHRALFGGRIESSGSFAFGIYRQNNSAGPMSALLSGYNNSVGEDSNSTPRVGVGVLSASYELHVNGIVDTKPVTLYLTNQQSNVNVASIDFGSPGATGVPEAKHAFSKIRVVGDGAPNGSTTSPHYLYYNTSTDYFGTQAFPFTVYTSVANPIVMAGKPSSYTLANEFIGSDDESQDYGGAQLVVVSPSITARNEPALTLCREDSTAIGSGDQIGRINFSSLFSESGVDLNYTTANIHVTAQGGWTAAGPGNVDDAGCELVIQTTAYEQDSAETKIQIGKYGTTNISKNSDPSSNNFRGADDVSYHTRANAPDACITNSYATQGSVLEFLSRYDRQSGPDTNIQQSDLLGEIRFKQVQTVQLNDAALIRVQAEDDWTSTSFPTKMMLCVTRPGSTSVSTGLQLHATKRTSIGDDHTGVMHCLHVTSASSGGGNPTSGTDPSGFIGYFVNEDTSSTAKGVSVQIDSADSQTTHAFMQFRDAGGAVGKITGDGAGGVVYDQAFTGVHPSVTTNNISELAKGLIMSSTGQIWARNENTCGTGIPKLALANTENDKTVYGILSATSESNPESMYDGYNAKWGVSSDETSITVNSLGEGLIWVTNLKGEVNNGDYICSSEIAGYGQKQSDDILRNYTVAKCVEVIDWANVSDTINHEGIAYKKYLSACTYHCG